MNYWQPIAEHISTVSGEAFRPRTPSNIHGGCINQALHMSDGTRSYFVKLNQASMLDMFVAEADGLQEMAATETIRVPQPLCHGVADDRAYLVMDYLEMVGRGNAAVAGQQLAALHCCQQRQFGWSRDNTIGSTPQPNGPMDGWADFWRERRLGFQLRLAARNGYGGRLQSAGERLLESFPALLDHQPQASLLHGDLWGGNFSYDKSGLAVIFDPAVYYGDREADLAMTELFGGFPRDFYAGYQAAYPLSDGYESRKILYNLYHVINHLNLFGGGYQQQAIGMIERLLAELKA